MYSNAKSKILIKFRINNQLDKLNEGRESQAPHSQLELLETQINTKILQMQEKNAKVSRLKLDR